MTTRRAVLLRLTPALALLPAHRLWAAGLSGTWKFTWDTEGGVRESSLALTQDGDKLTGTMDKAELAGEVKDGRFRLAGKHHSAEAGYAAQLEINGTQQGAKLVGEGKWGNHAMKFTAVRAD